MPQTTDKAIRHILLERGWGIDEEAAENASGELFEFIHPEGGKKYTWFGALSEQMSLEAKKAAKRAELTKSLSYQAKKLECLAGHGILAFTTPEMAGVKMLKGKRSKARKT